MHTDEWPATDAQRAAVMFPFRSDFIPDDPFNPMQTKDSVADPNALTFTENQVNRVRLTLHSRRSNFQVLVFEEDFGMSERILFPDWLGSNHAAWMG